MHTLWRRQRLCAMEMPDQSCDRVALLRRISWTPSQKFSEVLLDTAELLAASYFDGQEAAALRVDFFVRWATAGAGARVWLNEVELGFNASALVGWYGERLTLLALRFWLLGGRSSSTSGS